MAGVFGPSMSTVKFHKINKPPGRWLRQFGEERLFFGWSGKRREGGPCVGLSLAYFHWLVTASFVHAPIAFGMR